MPTRGGKHDECRLYRVSFSAPVAKRSAKILKGKCDLSDKVAFRSMESVSVVLEWQDGARWDAVSNWVKRALSLKEKTFSLEAVSEPLPNPAIAEQVESRAAVSAAELAESSELLHNPVVADSVESRAAASVAEPVTEPVESRAVESLSPAFLQVKLLGLLQGRLSGDKSAAACDQGLCFHCEEVLGQGSFGRVYKGTCAITQRDVAIKCFRSGAEGIGDSFREVAALAAVGVHPHIAELLDVAVRHDCVSLVYTLHQKNLHTFINEAPLAAPTISFVLHCLCEALRHIHSRGCLHNDVKPANVFVTPPQTTQWTCFPVVLGDLGALRPGDPNHRHLRSLARVREEGLQEGTLWYRAPEVLSGFVRFSYAVDMWALGCIGAEMVKGMPLFTGAGQILTLYQIFQLFGTPSRGMFVDPEQCPLISKKVPAFEPKVWPPEGLQTAEGHLQRFLQAALQLFPEESMTADTALQHQYFQARALSVLVSARMAGQGRGSLLKGSLGPRLTEWVQGDPALSDFAASFRGKRKRARQCLKKKEVKARKKYEEAGFVHELPPKTRTIAKMDASKPMKARRLRHLVQEVMRQNRGWLSGLTLKVRKGLRCLLGLRTMLGKNGAEFFRMCFSKTAFAYATVQMMRPGQRLDPKHFDGGASLLHMAISVFGSRLVHCWFQEADAHEVFRQDAGDIYIGNMVAVEHQVEHLEVSQQSTLYREADGSDEFVVAVMFRSDIFRWARSRKLKGKPVPVGMYDKVNEIVAQHLASEPFVIPDFASVLRSFTEE